MSASLPLYPTPFSRIQTFHTPRLTQALSRLAQMKMPRLLFVIAAMLVVKAIVGIATVLTLAWPTHGAVIAPSILVVAIVCTATCYFWRKHAVGRHMFRCAITISIAVIGLYLSLGPASWLVASYKLSDVEQQTGNRVFHFLYDPIVANAIFAPEPIRSCSINYVAWWTPSGVSFKTKKTEYTGISKMDMVLDFRITILTVDWSCECFYIRDSDFSSRQDTICLLYTSPSPRDQRGSRMPSSA